MLTIVRVSSGNVECFAWHEGTLYVQFKKTLAVYRYDHVPETVFHDMRNAESVGKFFHAYVKQYGGVQIPHELALSHGFETKAREETPVPSIEVTP